MQKPSKRNVLQSRHLGTGNKVRTKRDREEEVLKCQRVHRYSQNRSCMLYSNGKRQTGNILYIFSFLQLSVSVTIGMNNMQVVYWRNYQKLLQNEASFEPNHFSAIIIPREVTIMQYSSIANSCFPVNPFINPWEREKSSERG